MSRILAFSSLVFLSLFVFVEIAYAEVIRGGGRPVQSRVYDQTIYYVNDQYNNSAGIDERTLPGFFASPLLTRLDEIKTTATINGDLNPIDAFPANSGCTRGYETGIVDSARERIDFLEGVGGNRTPGEEAEYNDLLSFIAEVEVNDPCKWQFTQGEEISVEGLFQSVFTGFAVGEIEYAVNWEIDGVTHEGEIDLVDGENFAAVTLNKLIDLAPGEYNISVSVGISSSQGQFYLVNPGPSNGSETPINFEEVCADNPNYIEYDTYIDNYLAANPGATEDEAIDAYGNDFNASEDFQCGFNSVFQDGNFDELYNIDLVTNFLSLTETLIILADDQVNDVNAPATLGAFITGLFAIGLRRKYKSK